MCGSGVGISTVYDGDRVTPLGRETEDREEVRAEEGVEVRGRGPTCARGWPV